jgi:hypothetical protein
VVLSTAKEPCTGQWHHLIATEIHGKSAKLVDKLQISTERRIEASAVGRELGAVKTLMPFAYLITPADSAIVAWLNAKV